MKKKYNWTTKMDPLLGIAMYDNDGNLGNLPIAFHQRDSEENISKQIGEAQ